MLGCSSQWEFRSAQFDVHFVYVVFYYYYYGLYTYNFTAGF